MAVELSPDQIDAISRLHNGSILCGNVGSGKSRTALTYYMFRVVEGKVRVNGFGFSEEMKKPRDLYIITTAKKRDSREWEEECADYFLFRDRENSLSNVQVIIDSWNNIKKYKDVYGAFFIFDEQRLVGSGAWVKTFLNIARKNQWILLTATPADTYSDLIPVFIANGYYRTKTEFYNAHCVFSPYVKYRKIERYVGTKHLDELKDKIIVILEDHRNTIRHNIYISVEYDRLKYKTIMRDRWDPYEEEPIEEMGKLMYLIRRVVNSDQSRIGAVDEIVDKHNCVIIFYNFTYELEMLRAYAEYKRIKYKEWNGQKHEDLPKGDRWLYLVQYTAGCEGWNCITTNVIIMFSQTYSYRVLEQASGRIDRMNTPFENLYYYHLKSTAPIDLAIYHKLKTKQNFNERSFIRRNI